MKSRVAGLAVVLVLLGRIALAQSSDEVNAGLQFNFMNPGAISLGMGGAFIGRADDATAAYANPAGLMNISRAEASLETRAWQYTNFTPVRGHGFGEPTNRGVDTIAGIEEEGTRRSVQGVSFASIVYPADRWSVSFYFHELANFSAAPRSEGIFYNDGERVVRTFATRSRIDLRVMSIGGAAAFRLTDSLALGIDVSRATLDLSSRTERFLNKGSNEADFADLRSAQVQRGKGAALRLGGGLQWKPLPYLSLGAVYKRGPSFPVTVSVLPPLPKGESDCSGRFHIPDIYGLGASYQATPYLVFNADANRVTYSRLTRDFVSFQQSGNCQSEARATQFRVRDATEYHAGARYTFADGVFGFRRPVIVSAGWWRDPPHSLEHLVADDPQSLLFSTTRSNHHYSCGVSLAVNRWYQVSAAVDLSRRQRIVSLSGIFRF